MSDKKLKRRRRWSVVSRDMKFVSGRGGSMAWTYDLAEAKRIAKAINGGQVVATSWLRSHYDEYRKNGGVIPAEHRPEDSP